MKKTTAILLAACFSTPLISHTVTQNVSAQNAGGITAWWVAEDFTNTNQGTAANWTDRISGIQAAATDGGKGVYPYLNAAGNGVTFTRSGASRSDAGAFFNVTNNPVAGKTDYTILVDFTPSAPGSTGNDNFWQDSGLVAAEQGGVTNDWGLGYDSAGHVVTGTNGMTVDSKDTIAVGTNAIAGMTVSGGATGSWINGVLSAMDDGSAAVRNTTTMFIGKMGADGGWYAGDIGEIRIFDHALTAGEMAAHTDIMKNGTAAYVWNSGTGNWGDASWTNDAGNQSTLAANSHAFINGGTLTMAASPVVKSLTVGSGKTDGTAVLIATADTQKGAQSLSVIPGGTLRTNEITTNVYYGGGTIEAASLDVKSGGLLEFNKPLTIDSTETLKEVVVNGGTFRNDGGHSSYLYVGNTATGTLTLNSGTFSLSNILKVGATAGSSGTINVNNGTFNVLPTITNSCGIDLAPTAGAAGTMNVKGGTSTVQNLNVGQNGTGTYNQTGGSLTAKAYFSIADQTSANGTANVSGGTLTVMHLMVGNRGTGSLTQTGGSVAGTNVNIGSGEVSKGTLNINGGTFSAVNYISIADGAGSTGTVNVSAGTVTSQWLSAGNRGTGTYTQTGGFHTTDHMFVAHNNNEAVGRLELKGGVLKVKQDSTIQRLGDGKMTFSGGLFETASLANAQHMTWTGGTLMTKSVTGDLTQNGGVLSVGGHVTQGLTWTRQKWTGVNDAFPGYTQQGSGHYVPTYEQIDAFWEKAQNAVPVASGLGAVGSGVVNEEYFTLLYDGWIYVDKADTYTFSFNADDGGFIYVDGQKVAEMSTVQSSSPWGRDSVSTPIQLAEGWHYFDMRYYEGWGGQNINKAAMTDSAGNVTDLRSTSNENFAMVSYEKELAELKIDGSYTQGKDGKLFMEIDLTSGEQDRLITTGDLELDGEIFIDIVGEISDTYEFELFDSENGEMTFNFASIDFSGLYDDASYWDLTGLMAGGDGILRFNNSSVPEPATWILFVLGACGFGILRRNRKNSARG